jgi:hypothetical protein
MSRAAGRLWHVTLTLQGRPAPLEELRVALHRLCALDPMNLGVRYREDRAELQFWDEGPELGAVAAAAALLWSDSQADTGLPRWSLVGLEVLQQSMWRERSPAAVVAPGSVAQLP